MALKTFNLNPEVYKEFSDYCKKQGLSMSKKIEKYIKEELKKIKMPQMKDLETDKEHSMSRYC